jgi:hypothetical protein
VLGLGLLSANPVPTLARVSAAAPKPTPCVPPPDLRPPNLIATPQTCVERVRAAAAEATLAAAPPTPTADFGFAPAFGELQAALGSVIGHPVADAQPGRGSACDLEQLTDKGMAYWTCASDVSGFVAYADQRHWAVLAGQLYEWFGDSAEIPTEAARYAWPSATSVVCVGPNDSVGDACMLLGGATTAGEIHIPSGNAVFEFQLTDPGAAVDLSLTSLPADYDLYLVDASSSILAQSVNEGLDPESVSAVLPGGAYFIYVHSDIGRTVAPGSLFLLHLSVSAAPSL